MTQIDGGTARVRRRQIALLAALCLVLGACASPVRAIRVDWTAAHRDLTRSAIITGDPSWSSRGVLLERGLFDGYAAQPERALAELHRIMVAEKGEPSFRLAADLYNWGLTSAFASEDGSEVEPRAGTFDLPFGSIAVDFDPAELRAGNRELYRLVPIAELEVKGLAIRYRWPGIGAPLAASRRTIEGVAAAGLDMVAPKLQVPLTALLRIAQPGRALVDEESLLTATLELHLAWDGDSVTIAGEEVPIESEPTAALALTFTGMPIIQLELFGFLGRLAGLLADRPPLVSTTPYRPGLVPVVFVHGTASSVVRWAELYMPFQLTRLSTDLALNRDATRSPFMPTAVDNMSPRSPFIMGLQQIPVEPPIAAHSIIAVDGTGDGPPDAL